MRLNLIERCNTPDKQLAKNVRWSRHFPRVRWAHKEEVLKYPPCAVVGGNPNIENRLAELREYERQGRDIFAINDTAGYLSSQGIPCFMFAIDASPVLYKSGILVKGAIFATRVHRNQFKAFGEDMVATFDMAEDTKMGGVTGGPTAACRAPMLFLRMGYKGVWFYGVDACFYDLTHVSGEQTVAYDNMIIVRANGQDFLTNASLLIQTEWLVDNIRKHPKFLINRSGGLIEAMLADDNWEVRAIGEDLKKQYDSLGVKVWNKEVPEEKLWRQPQAQAS